MSKDNEQRLLLQGFLQQANVKTYGRDIILKDLVLIALPKLTTKDIEKIQESSLSEMERVERALDEHNRKADTKLTLGGFLVKKLGIAKTGWALPKVQRTGIFQFQMSWSVS